ncbi:hypothetical protein STRTUCAR8_05053 [Streptomyces turgidiscabies Car8]|uniref:PIN domain-containing protein n=1 Tax=Streptomyces turgidiscabies (strain Car8) TaxID=698760 RepID=L7FHM9_STRT8|nr:hypothetical protein STRTUCAR8_05053 [Streptomyces turgidiscabies Car8]GAQ69096.1 hypothetical protein T45_00818 [Streptomyces turgidiscabies]
MCSHFPQVGGKFAKGPAGEGPAEPGRAGGDRPDDEVLKLHGHKYAIDAVLAVIARQQKGRVTVLTSDVDDLEKLVPDTIVVKKV